MANHMRDCVDSRKQKFKDNVLPRTGYEDLSSQPALINRAIGMHFLREGQFSVASAFLNEALPDEKQFPSQDATMADDTKEEPLRMDSLKSEALRKQFANMYHILDEMKTNKNLIPATEWARANSEALQGRGSNLEFDLGRLRFVSLFLGDTGTGASRSEFERQQDALAYAREAFGIFQGRYLREIQQLTGAMAFRPNLADSPYRHIFHNQGAWEDLAMSFTREFCSLLGLSADSPMYIATTAGAIALPTLQKLQKIMEKKKTEWTTQNELPVCAQTPHISMMLCCDLRSY